jgi:CheY-like chemotaxis protein/HPt (histidine-containing phosphotransfer) domain-containing protein
MSRILGGDLAVESVCGSGSTFTVRVKVGPLHGVPMARDLQEAGVVETVVVLPSPQQLSLACSVLLAEDGPDNQVLVATLLRKAGATVVVAEDGERAVELALRSKAEGRPFEVILMDMQMPKLDGYGAATQLRANGWKGPIVALTAHAMTGCREQCIAAGCDDYIAKPVDRMLLLSTVKARSERRIASLTLAAVAAPPTPSKNDAATLEGAQPPESPLYSVLADDPDLTEILPQFVNGLSETVRQLVRAVDANDERTLSRLAHQLKGAAGGYGFPTITSQAKLVEDGLRGGIPKRAMNDAVEELVRRCSAARVSVYEISTPENA